MLTPPGLVARATSLFLCYNIAVSLMDSMSVWIEIVILSSKLLSGLSYDIHTAGFFYKQILLFSSLQLFEQINIA